MESFKAFLDWIRSLDSTDALSILLVSMTLLGLFAGCRVLDLNLKVREIDVLHEQTTNAASSGASTFVKP